jgi:hypothetical protein
MPSSGKRVVSVTVNGSTVNPSLTLYNSSGVGFTPFDVSIPVNTTTAQIQISLGPISNCPAINAIEITQRPQITQADVIGLLNALSVTVTRGPSYTAGAVPYVNANGALDTVTGSDCVRGDGSTTACAPSFALAEVPQSVQGFAYGSFSITHTPLARTLMLFRNGLIQQEGVDFVLTGGTVSFLGEVNSEDTLQAFYQY